MRRELGKEPGQHSRVNSGVFAQGDVEISLGRKPGLVEKIEVDEIARLGAREDTGQFARPEIRERFDDDLLDRGRWSRDVGDGLMNDIDLNTVSVSVLESGAHEMAHVAQQSDPYPGARGSAGEKTDEGSHVLSVMDEKIDVSGRPMAQIYPGESRPATQVTRDAPLASADEIEDEIRDDPAVESLTHRFHGSGREAAIPAAGA